MRATPVGAGRDEEPLIPSGRGRGVGGFDYDNGNDNDSSDCDSDSDSLTSIAPFAMPQLVQKFYAIKDARSVRIGMVASTIFALIVTGTAYFTDALTRIFLAPDTHPAAFSDGRPVFDALMPELLATVIPPALGIVIFLLILSAPVASLLARTAPQRGKPQ